VHRLYFWVNSDALWNWLDFALTLLGLVDFILSSTGNSFSPTSVNPTLLRLLRFLRLTKILRLVKVLKSVKELRLLLKCLVGSLPAFMWSVILFASSAALFATVIVQQVSEVVWSDAGSTEVSELLAEFGSIEMSTLSLLKAISGGNDWDTYFQLLGTAGSTTQFTFLIFVVFAWLSMTNVITSLFLEKAMQLAQPDLDDMLVSRRREDLANAEELKALFANLDTNNDGTLNFDEFQASLQDPSMVHYFGIKGFNFNDAEMCFKMLQDAGQRTDVDIDTFVGGFMKMKGVAMNIDIMSLQYNTAHISETQQISMLRISEEIRQLSTVLDTVLDSLQGFERPLPSMGTELHSAFTKSRI